MNGALLRKKMKEKHASVSFLAVALGISNPTFYSRANLGSFKEPEKDCIEKMLQLTKDEKDAIFSPECCIKFTSEEYT